MQEATAQFTQGNLSGTPEAAAGERPEWLPENFKTVEDYNSSYKELQAELTRLKQGGEEAPAEGSEEETPPTNEEIDAQAEAAGVDMAALQAEFDADGKLSDASYEKLASLGFEKSFVDEIVTLRAGQAEKMRSELLTTVGGEESLAKMVTWAAKAYNDEQIKEYNDAVNSGSRVRAEQALKALKADFTTANPARPKFIKADAGDKGGMNGGAYSSTAEMQADISNPRYKKDPVFRAQVAQRVALSQR